MIGKSAVKGAAPGSDPATASEKQTADYIAELIRELERLARKEGLVRLQYLLIECREEAERVIAEA